MATAFKRTVINSPKEEAKTLAYSTTREGLAKLPDTSVNDEVRHHNTKAGTGGERICLSPKRGVARQPDYYPPSYRKGNKGDQPPVQLALAHICSYVEHKNKILKCVRNCIPHHGRKILIEKNVGK